MFLGKLRYYYLKYVLRRLTSKQRKFFDRELIPKYAGKRKKILFIGVEWYNAWIFKKYKSSEWVSIDPESANIPYGAKNHVHGKFPRDFNISIHENSFDVIFCNGVYGWGVNSKKDLELLMRGIHSLINPNGTCIFGYNTSKKNNPLTSELLNKLVTSNFSINDTVTIQGNHDGDNHIFHMLKRKTDTQHKS